MRLLWCAPALALAAGCSDSDVEAMERIGRTVAAKAEGVAAGLPTESLTAAGVEARVAARIRGDKQLDGAAVTVKAANGVVTLTGRVKDATQRERAVELATATVGVDKVDDRLAAGE